MAKNKIEIKVDSYGEDCIKNLLELLTMYIDELPKELQEQLKIGAENGFCDFTVQDFFDMFPKHDFSKVECSHDNLTMVNKVLKKIEVIEYCGKEIQGFKTLYPEHFYLKYRGETIIGWQS